MKMISKQLLQILYCHRQRLVPQLTEERKKFPYLPTPVLGLHLHEGHWMWCEVTDQILAGLFHVLTL